jgi:hypothetical protein
LAYRGSEQENSRNVNGFSRFFNNPETSENGFGAALAARRRFSADVTGADNELFGRGKVGANET